MPAFGAKSWSLTRSVDDPLAFRQSSVWENRTDFERYWYSPEVTAAREQVIDLYDKPLLPAWHTLLAAE
jgi:quinol monooxygenase YgiN